MKKYTEINIGDRETLAHTVTDRDIEKFINLTGDDNKLHVDKNFATKTQLKKPVVHGMLSASFISTLIGTKLPGDGALWCSQTLEFILPVHVNDTITIIATVTKKIDREKIIELTIEIKNQHKQLVTKGLSKVKVLEQQEKTIDAEEVPSQKTALVLGGTGGIGSAVCKQLATEGFSIFIHYFSNKVLASELKDFINSTGGKATIIQADITVSEEVNSLYNNFQRNAMTLDVLVNCSSIKIPRISFPNLEWRSMEEQITFNIKPIFEIVKIFLDLLKAGRPGKIINLGTLATDKVNGDWLHYITAKSALIGFTKALSFELGPSGVRVNIVSPGLTDTELTSDISEKDKLISASQTPLRKLATTQDVAGVISFLASDKSNYLTGQNIRVNGGQFSI
ncbi:3-oxoacyl-[acyl-carrier protein] reductase [Algoriphagus sp. 4150]|uniref:SDR family oxidoreductase n=1 Tax=Algoriphagus sp. 4150 TaxID=2817756 RepID=UPI0028586EB4|nr:SDR family oxidoreductase [Algoriphagus sp. 4150]MDR7132691.1 3-oxoacyl-[acyl-carrier protein] reductase [Algoriphagus sp. 4150]